MPEVLCERSFFFLSLQIFQKPLDKSETECYNIMKYKNALTKRSKSNSLFRERAVGVSAYGYDRR